MTKEQSVELMTDKMAKFVAYVGKKLPDDVEAKLQELRQQETTPLATAIYDTMARNQKLAVDLNRPCCQDTGVLQFWVKCGVNFPLMGELEALLKEAVVRATFAAPLRHNSVEAEQLHTAAQQNDAYHTGPAGSRVAENQCTHYHEDDADECQSAEKYTKACRHDQWRGRKAHDAFDGVFEQAPEIPFCLACHTLHILVSKPLGLKAHPAENAL